LVTDTTTRSCGDGGTERFQPVDIHVAADSHRALDESLPVRSKLRIPLAAVALSAANRADDKNWALATLGATHRGLASLATYGRSNPTARLTIRLDFRRGTVAILAAGVRLSLSSREGMGIHD
jgi:hypothetical protein